MHTDHGSAVTFSFFSLDYVSRVLRDMCKITHFSVFFLSSNKVVPFQTGRDLESGERIWGDRLITSIPLKGEVSTDDALDRFWAAHAGRGAPRPA
jgi:hypothetical protein